MLFFCLGFSPKFAKGTDIPFSKMSNRSRSLFRPLLAGGRPQPPQPEAVPCTLLQPGPPPCWAHLLLHVAFLRSCAACPLIIVQKMPPVSGFLQPSFFSFSPLGPFTVELFPLSQGRCSECLFPSKVNLGLWSTPGTRTLTPPCECVWNHGRQHVRPPPPPTHTARLLAHKIAPLELP